MRHVTKMQKRWTINPHGSGSSVATPIEDRIKRSPLARRTRQRLNREFGLALELRGAVKQARLKKLTRLAGTVPGYVISESATGAVRTAHDQL